MSYTNIGYESGRCPEYDKEAFTFDISTMCLATSSELKKIKARQSTNTTKFSNKLKASACTNTMLDNVDNFSHTTSHM
jgi:hypothetical protein